MTTHSLGSLELLQRRIASEQTTPEAQMPGGRQREKLKIATQEFEAVFIGLMLKQVRKSLMDDNPLFGKSQEAKFYQEMMDEKLAEQMSRTGQFGLARTLYQRMERTLPADPRETLQRAALLPPTQERR